MKYFCIGVSIPMGLLCTPASLLPTSPSALGKKWDLSPLWQGLGLGGCRAN